MSDESIWREYGTPLLRPLGSGPLGGEPLNGRTAAVKDLFAVAGFPTGAGNPRWLAQARLEPRDAWAVRALRLAGAAIAGIAQTDELAFSLSGTNAHYGTPPNPAAPGLVTGGSSSGPAAAVAAGQADIGLGTDTAGSIRVPAAVCGLFGLRPTYGAVPADGVLPLAPSFDTVGWLTADAALLAAVGSVLLPPAASPSPFTADPPRRLLSPDPPNERVLRLAVLDDADFSTERRDESRDVIVAPKLAGGDEEISSLRPRYRRNDFNAVVGELLSEHHGQTLTGVLLGVAVDGQWIDDDEWWWKQ
jgi:Asp-tRNA(Asn)/Glu-tRNA(Gln) amidotransferase A subunit family amidase